MSEFNFYTSGQEITKLIQGKTIVAVETEEPDSDYYLLFRFTDGTTLCIRYDYIYEWEVEKPMK